MKNIYLIMDEMDLSQRYLGYEYIACAVAVIENGDSQIQMKVVYREVARTFQTSPACVERDIRTAARVLMQSQTFQRAFHGKRMANGDFLRTMIRLSGKITKKPY